MPTLDSRKLRLLVTITNFGEKNVEFLKTVISGYQSFPMDVDIVVLSDRPKNLGANVKVVVGLPSKDPWSLPFGHKRIFAENVDRYDLFAYSEDDIEVTSAHIESFLRITPALKRDEIVGYLLYEVNENGTRILPNMHGPHHWYPASVKQRGDYTIAEFSNEHSAFYLLTREQLKRAIASGGFLREPYEGKYDMLCAAATDPYTSCGFHKVICISHIEDFLLHHLPNRYLSRYRVSLPELKEQIQTLRAIGEGKHPSTTLFEQHRGAFGMRYPKSYYEEPNKDLLNLIPPGAKQTLSIGCGWGAAENQLQQYGLEVTALPLDSVIGTVAVRRGIRIVYGTFEEAIEQLQSSQFDCVILTDLLHLLPDPAACINRCAPLLRQGGSLLLGGPNFDYLPIFLRRLLRKGEYAQLGHFDRGGVDTFNIQQLRRWLRRSGLEADAIAWKNTGFVASLSGTAKPLSWARRIAKGAWYWLVSITLGKNASINDKPNSIPNEGSHFRRFLADSWVVRARQLSTTVSQLPVATLAESAAQQFETSDTR